MKLSKTIKKIIIFTFFLAIFFGLFIYFNIFLKNSHAKSNLVDWGTYENLQLGVSFRHPRYVNRSEMVFFQAGDVLVVTTVSSSLYQHKDELSYGYTGGMMMNELSKLEEKYPYLPSKSWKIWVRNLSNEDDLKKFIQDIFKPQFFDGCKLGYIQKNEQPGMFDVIVDSVNKPVDLNDYSNYSCWINWKYNFKYSKLYKRAAMWNVGQEDQFFLLDSDSSTSIDDEMAKSFIFI
jgi:hypothetical protein